MEASSRRKAIRTTIQHLAARWAGADRYLLRHVFPMLAAGKPVRVQQIAEITTASTERIDEALLRARAGRDSQGRIVELSGLTLAPTFHRVEIDGVSLFSCCALLAHLVPLLLGDTVSLESVDPQNRSLVRLELTPAGISSHDPETAVGSFVITEPHAVAKDVGANFCTHVQHFSDRQSAADFVLMDPRRFVVDLPELREAAQALHRAAWS